MGSIHPVFSEEGGREERGWRNRDGYAQVADRLGMGVAAVKKAAQRLRERYHKLLCEEVAQTVKDPGEAAEEMRYLFAVLHE